MNPGPCSFDDLRRLVDQFRLAPVTTRIDVHSIAELRSLTGNARPTDALGVAVLGDPITGVPVYEDADVPTGMAKCTKSDGTHEMVSLR